MGPVLFLLFFPPLRFIISLQRAGGSAGSITIMACARNGVKIELISSLTFVASVFFHTFNMEKQSAR